jgi:hypothetical protein
MTGEATTSCRWQGLFCRSCKHESVYVRAEAY